MKHLFKIASIILPMVLLSSCGGAKNYPYEGETIELEKPLKIEIQSISQGHAWLTGDDLNTFFDKYLKDIKFLKTEGRDLNTFFDKYLKDIKFLKTEGRFHGSGAVLLWYEDRNIGLIVGCTNYGLLYIEDLENMKFYAALEEINFENFNSDLFYYFDKNI